MRQYTRCTLRGMMEEGQPGSGKNEFPWHLGVYDAHCHPTDSVPSFDRIAAMKTRVLTIMATRAEDQNLVADFADRLGVTDDFLHKTPSVEEIQMNQGHLIPCWGQHPWFSHHMYDDIFDHQDKGSEQPSKVEHYRNVLVPQPKDDDDFILCLPDPCPLSNFITQTRAYLERYPFALVGEIGLDRAFRVPGLETGDNRYERDPASTPGGREGRRLSPFRVNMAHQKKVLKAQLNLAGEMQRAVSVHGVAAHGVVFDSLQETWHGFENTVLSRRQKKRQEIFESESEERLKAESLKPFPPRICLHSYSGPADTLKQYFHTSIPAVMFFSFSRLVNFSSPTSDKAVDVIKAVPDDRILAESDLHTAGETMDDLLEEIVRTICNIKGWPLEKGVKQLASNWIHYVFGNEQVPNETNTDEGK